MVRKSNFGDKVRELTLSTLLNPSRNTGQGVMLSGKIKRLHLEIEAKASAAHARRLPGFKRADSHSTYT